MAKYTLDLDMLENPFHHQLIRKDLTAKVNNLTPIIAEEIGLALERQMNAHASGSLDDGQWRDIHIWSVILKVIAQTSNRMFVGDELCREDGYLDAMVRYASLIMPVAQMIRLFPTVFYP